MIQTSSRDSKDERLDWGRAVAEYYRDAHVRQRMIEFLGGRDAADVTSVYINANDASMAHHFAPLAPTELDRCLAEGKEICRSLWDRENLLAHLDIEYVNFDYPGETYQHFQQAFERQQPVIGAIEAALWHFGISARHVLSGRGHHFVWQIRQGSEAFEDLARLGRMPATLQSKYSQPLASRGEAVEPAVGGAFAGLGLVLEHLAHEVLRAVSGPSDVPVTVTAVETRSRRGQRESVSFDLSEYGDPLHMRSIRVPYSVYYKPWQQQETPGQPTVEGLVPLFLVPVDPLDPREALLVMREVAEVRKLARVGATRIPEQSCGTSRLMESYRRSELARIHDWFYSQEHDEPAIWHRTYDATALEVLPPSARKILLEPNDLLCKPACLQHIVRLFLALGWHPRHIAGLVRSKFERDYGWGYEWFSYDAATRADFYCRLFTGLVLTGVDDLSAFECPPVGRLQPLAGQWQEDFEPYRQSLKRRLTYDRLASRPFHGLFL